MHNDEDKHRDQIGVPLWIAKERDIAANRKQQNCVQHLCVGYKRHFILAIRDKMTEEAHYNWQGDIRLVDFVAREEEVLRALCNVQRPCLTRVREVMHAHGLADTWNYVFAVGYRCQWECFISGRVDRITKTVITDVNNDLDSQTALYVRGYLGDNHYASIGILTLLDIMAKEEKYLHRGRKAIPLLAAIYRHACTCGLWIDEGVSVTQKQATVHVKQPFHKRPRLWCVALTIEVDREIRQKEQIARFLRLCIRLVSFNQDLISGNSTLFQYLRENHTDLMHASLVPYGGDWTLFFGRMSSIKETACLLHPPHIRTVMFGPSLLAMPADTALARMHDWLYQWGRRGEFHCLDECVRQTLGTKHQCHRGDVMRVVRRQPHRFELIRRPNGVQIMAI